MQANLALKNQKYRRKALVLGERALEGGLARGLEAEGFDPVSLKTLSQGRLPSLGDLNYLSKIRSLLVEFALLSRDGGSGEGGSEEGGVVHPGTTLWAERPELSRIGQELGLTVIAPPTRILSLFGNKLNFLLEAERLGVPTLVQNNDPIHTVREIYDSTQGAGQRFPFVLKSVKGGGSFGIFVVSDPQVLEKQLPLWLDQLRRNLGEVILFTERYIDGARHVTVPFARFQDGQLQIFPLVDASLKYQQRKLIEFCPATQVDEQVRKQLENWTHYLAESCGFVGVGEFEFVVDGPRAFLVEGLARLNTGFQLWENIADTHAVSWQLATMAGSVEKSLLLSKKPVKLEAEWASGLILRLQAEDCLLHLPQPGRIHELSERRKWEVGSTSAELSLGYEAGESISILDSGILGSLRVTGQNRAEAIQFAERVVNEIWIAGSLQTNERFLVELLTHPWIQEEIFHAGFVDEDFVPTIRPSAELAQLAAEVCAELPQVKALVSGSAKASDKWVIGVASARFKANSLAPVRWLTGPSFWTVQGKEGVSGLAGFQSGGFVQVCAFPLEGRWLVRIGSGLSGGLMSVRRVQGAEMGTEPVKVPKVHSLYSMVNGRIHALFFRAGVRVPAHEPLVIVESLGRLVPHALPAEARAICWKVKAEDAVTLGQELAEIELLV